MSEFFNVPLIASSYEGVDLGLKSHMKEAWDRTYDPWLVTQDVLLHLVIVGGGGGVLMISEGSDQTTEICWCALSECAGWSVSSYKFYCRFCHAQTLVPVVCANFNAKHPGYNFQQTTFWNIFLILPREHYLHFMQIVSTAWNVKSCFLGNEKKKKKENKFNLSSAELAQKTLTRRCASFIQCVSFTR